MKTIGAKELRTHLDEILDSVLSGEDVVVQHRFKKPVRISAYQPTREVSVLEGLALFDAASKRPINNKSSSKAHYHEHLNQKYNS